MASNAVAAQNGHAPNLPAQQSERKPQNLPAWHGALTRMRDEFSKALPGHITPEKFIRTAQTAAAMTRNIENVRDSRSLLAACTKAAADGLILDGREAALRIDQKGEVQYMPMVRGLLKLAYNSGEIKSIVIEAVRKGDVFDYSPTRAAEPIIHKIDLLAERGEVYAVYAIAALKSGGIEYAVMTVQDVNRIRDRSDGWKAFKAGKIKSTPWSADWDEMAKKTVFRRLSKHLPSSADRQGDAPELADDDVIYDVTPAAPAPSPAVKQRGGAAAALKDVTPAQQPDEQPAPPVDAYDHDTGEVIDATADDGLDIPPSLRRTANPQPGDDI